MCSNNDYRNYLAHHGVIGMKWGVRRYQPYGEGGYNPKKITKNRRAMLRAMKKSHKKYMKSKGEAYFYGYQPEIGTNTERVYKEYRNKRKELDSVKKQYSGI